MPARNFCGRTRREMLWESGCGFSGIAMASLLGQDSLGREARAEGLSEYKNPLAPSRRTPARAKACIFLFMYGGPSHIDTFDYKPAMIGMDGKTIAVKTFGRGGTRMRAGSSSRGGSSSSTANAASGSATSSRTSAENVDDIAFLHSMTADSPIHGSAMLQMNSGKILSRQPVPRLVGELRPRQRSTRTCPASSSCSIRRGGPISGAEELVQRLHARHLPGDGPPVRRARRSSISPARRTLSKTRQRHLLDTLQEYNDEHLTPRADNSNLAARIASYELAYKMQSSAPEAVDCSTGNPSTSRSSTASTTRRRADFGAQVLLARRLVERGVRFIQIYSGGAHNDDNWDAHGDLDDNHNLPRGRHRQADRRRCSQDLKQRGLLDETLVVWGGEFGRQPTAEYAEGTGPRPQRLRLHDVDGGRRHQGRHQRRRDRRTRQRRRRRTACTSSTSTPRSCSRWASTPTTSPTSTAASTRSSSASKSRAIHQIIA